jgi:hypothetical protein
MWRWIPGYQHISLKFCPGGIGQPRLARRLGPMCAFQLLGSEFLPDGFGIISRTPEGPEPVGFAKDACIEMPGGAVSRAQCRHCETESKATGLNDKNSMSFIAAIPPTAHEYNLGSDLSVLIRGHNSAVPCQTPDFPLSISGSFSF